MLAQTFKETKASLKHNDFIIIEKNNSVVHVLQDLDLGLLKLLSLK